MLVFLPSLYNGVDRYNDTYLFFRIGLIAPHDQFSLVCVHACSILFAWAGARGFYGLSFVSTLASFSQHGLMQGGSMGSHQTKVFRSPNPVPSVTTIQSYTVSLVFLLSIISAYAILTALRYGCVAGIYFFVSVCFGFSFDQSFNLANLDGSNMLMCL